MLRLATTQIKLSPPLASNHGTDTLWLLVSERMQTDCLVGLLKPLSVASGIIGGR